MPRMSDTQRKRLANNVIVALSGEMAKQGLLRKEVEGRLPMSATTYSKRIKNPGEFTLNELCLLSNALNTTVINLLQGRVTGLDI